MSTGVEPSQNLNVRAEASVASVSRPRSDDSKSCFQTRAPQSPGVSQALSLMPELSIWETRSGSNTLIKFLKNAEQIVTFI